MVDETMPGLASQLTQEHLQQHPCCPQTFTHLYALLQGIIDS